MCSSAKHQHQHQHLKNSIRYTITDHLDSESTLGRKRRSSSSSSSLISLLSSVMTGKGSTRYNLSLICMAIILVCWTSVTTVTASYIHRHHSPAFISNVASTRNAYGHTNTNINTHTYTHTHTHDTQKRSFYKTKLFFENDQDQISFEQTIQSVNDDTDMNTNNDINHKQKLNEYQNKKLDVQLVLIDNYDSYTYNIYSYLCTMCKHEPIVVSNDAYPNWDDMIEALNSNIQNLDSESDSDLDSSRSIDGIIISPGPGRPECADDMGVCLEAIEKNPDMPILGVCLGHQALGYYYNASVALAPCGPIHGLTSKVWYEEDNTNKNANVNKNANANNQNKDQTSQSENQYQNQSHDDNTKRQCNIFQNIPQLFDVVRYHSLVVEFPQDDNQLNQLDIEPIAWCIGNPSSDEDRNEVDAVDAVDGNGNGSSNTDSSANVNANVNENKDEKSICMALKHKHYPHYGVQFHPESVGTGEVGYKIFENFCHHCLDWKDGLEKPMNMEKEKETEVTTTKNVNGDKLKNGYANGNAINSKIQGGIQGEKVKGQNNESDEEVKIVQERSLPPKYKVLIHKIDKSSTHMNDLPLPEKVFEELYASEDAAFWLDSSTGRKNADLDDMEVGVPISTAGNAETTSTSQCPIVSNSRFSIMGSNDGPLSTKIEYWGIDHPTDKRGVFVTEKEHGTLNEIKLESDLISYLNEEVSKNGIVQDTTCIEFVNENEYIEDILENSSTCDISIPFDYRGGYVGYLGYEVRHDTRQAICKQEICNIGESQINDNGADKSPMSNPNVPTAAFVFADRSLVYDHWRGDWYVVGIAENENISSTDGSNEIVVQWIRDIAQSLKMMAVDESKSGMNNPIETNMSINTTSPLDFSLVRSKDQYTKDISRCHDEIRNGESYELCLTNQFQTKVPFSNQNLASSPFGLYKILRKKNPSPFAAFLKFDSEGENKASASICCSSPERFLSISGISADDNTSVISSEETHGWEFAPPFVSSNTNNVPYIIESKPIKGTTKRTINDDDGVDRGIKMKEDISAAEELRTSVKNRAENLMIVDLLRNDLSRICEPGSVHVPKLMAIESFATVHQMVSTIRGLIKPGETPIDVISACFPGGSMTGAPKLRSVDILDEMELGKSRGPYSGCLGYISLNGCMDMNIIIRTAVVTPGTESVDSKDKHEDKGCTWDVAIGAGGAITALSDSEDEFDEMMLKSRAVKEAINEWYKDSCNDELR